MLIVLVVLSVTFAENAMGAKGERPPFTWSGRWEDGTGYFVDIRQSVKGYKLFRSGSDPGKLEFVAMTKDEFLYREWKPDYIHILKYESKDKIQDIWVDIEGNKVWKVDILTRKK